MNINCKTILNLWQHEEQNITKLLYRFLSGNRKDICIFMTNMPGIVSTPMGLKAWTKKGGRVEELISKGEITSALRGVYVTIGGCSFVCLLVCLWTA